MIKSNGNGAWIVWQDGISYTQGDIRVFKSELDALRWSHLHGVHTNVTFVPWGYTPSEAEAFEKED